MSRVNVNRMRAAIIRGKILKFKSDETTIVMESIFLESAVSKSEIFHMALREFREAMELKYGKDPAVTIQAQAFVNRDNMTVTIKARTVHAPEEPIKAVRDHIRIQPAGPTTTGRDTGRWVAGERRTARAHATGTAIRKAGITYVSERPTARLKRRDREAALVG